MIVINAYRDASCEWSEMLRLISTSIFALLVLSACSTIEGEKFAKPVASAVVELRDGPSARELAATTMVVVLGTGTPIPDAHRAGASIAVIHKGEAYLFDVGAGSVQNATTARYKYDIPSLYPTQVCCVFLTHLHNDHTLDLSELATTMWWRRPQQLRAWGPRGLSTMAAGIAHLMEPDVAIRSSGTQPVQNPEAHKVIATEIEAGIVFTKDDLVIEAFDVQHGDIEPAFAYRITTDDKSIVISGDTAYSEELLEMSRGVDLLFHEAISDAGLLRSSELFQTYHRRSHTAASDLGRLAAQARPGLLVLYHGLFYGVAESLIVDEVRATYDGAVVLADDLDIF